MNVFATCKYTLNTFSTQLKVIYIDNIHIFFQKHIEEMEAATFTKHVEALATKRLEKPKKLSSQNNQYWGEIESQQYNFDRGTDLG